MSNRTEIHHDESSRRFYAVIDGQTARLEYDEAGPETLDYYSTFVPSELRGRGIATDIARHALEFALERGKRVIPSCWFVRNLIDKDPAFERLRAGNTQRNG